MCTNGWLTRTVMGLLLLGATLSGSAAQESVCSGPQAREFDFWIGEWEVTARGKVAGHNSIQPILDGCVLQENWQGAGGGAGSSFNFYNPQTKQWQQFWVWRNGTTLELAGGYADGKMTLEGVSKNREGNTVHNRITWYHNDDGSVRQHWQTSGDGGKTWKDSFDGLYRKKGLGPGAPP